MPDLSGNVVLDVAIGLSFFYFVLSLVCSAVNEFVASVFAWRAKVLEEGVRSLLGDQTKASFYDNWRITVLKDKNGRNPSYIPARTFALAVLDTAAPDVAAKVAESPNQAPDADVFKKVKASVGRIENDTVKKVLTGALGKARENLDELRIALEEEFNTAMDRVSGWYKRRVQYFLLAIALIAAVAFNADSFTIGSRLAKDDAVRSAVVAQAIVAAEGEAPVAAPEPTGDLSETEDAFQLIGERVTDVQALDLPLGWSSENVPEITDVESGIKGVLAKLAGILVTAFAISLGAPFWFGLLGRFSSLRASGTPEETPNSDPRGPGGPGG